MTTPTNSQLRLALDRYSTALALRAASTRSLELVTLDDYFRTSLPALLQSRPTPYLTTHELGELMRWKLAVSLFASLSSITTQTNSIRISTAREMETTTPRLCPQQPRRRRTSYDSSRQFPNPRQSDRNPLHSSWNRPRYLLRDPLAIPTSHRALLLRRSRRSGRNGKSDLHRESA